MAFGFWKSGSRAVERDVLEKTLLLSGIAT